jgi:acetate kinase
MDARRSYTVDTSLHILCLDAGSSSLRFSIYDVEDARCEVQLSGEATGFRQSSGDFRVTLANQDIIHERAEMEQAWEVNAALERLWKVLKATLKSPLSAAGHRIVFGGAHYSSPTRVTAKILEELGALMPLDPLHLPDELGLVDAVSQRFTNLPQVLCFDTAFHRAMPTIAKMLPFPRDLDPKLERYGFHGLSYEYVVWKLGEAVRGRVIAAHLGNGASVCAIKDGRPIDTSMGFSPLSGLMMGTRPGDIDPGIVLYLLEERGYDADKLAELFVHRSGLLGLSQTSASMEILLKLYATDSRAREAVDLFIYDLVKQLGAMIAVLGGINTLVFTGGIGEHASVVRAKACEALSYLGLALDDEANASNAAIISRPDSSVKVQIVNTDENLMIARHTERCIRTS